MHNSRLKSEHLPSSSLISPNPVYMNFFRAVCPLEAVSTPLTVKPKIRLSQYNAQRFASTMEYTRQVEHVIRLVDVLKLITFTD